MDKEVLTFTTYCIGQFDLQFHLPQQEMHRSLKSSGIHYSYIVPSYDALLPSDLDT